MWKTRFEMSTNENNHWSRHRTLSSSVVIHQYHSQTSPTVPRVREDSPSAIVRPSPPSSMPSLDILTEEDENILCTTITNNEQPRPKRNSYQNIYKHQAVLPTIIESTDHEVMTECLLNQNNINVVNNEVTSQDSLVATNTNYNQVMNMNIERKERKSNPDKNHKISGFSLEKRINDLLQYKNQRKLTSSSTDVNKNEIFIPTTFKDISAFFENKALVASTTNTIQQKKMVRAKRSLPLNRYISVKNNDLPKLDILSSTEEESTVLHHQIKRIKKTHRFEYDSLTEAKVIVENSFTKQSINYNRSIETREYKNRLKHSSTTTNNMSWRKTLCQRWFIPLLLINIVLVYYYLFNTINNYKNLFVHLPNSASSFSPLQFKESIDLKDKNLISQYGQFVGNYFFPFVDALITFLGQLFFRIDKYEYKNNIIYVATSTYEHICDWFSNSFK